MCRVLPGDADGAVQLDHFPGRPGQHVGAVDLDRGGPQRERGAWPRRFLGGARRRAGQRPRRLHQDVQVGHPVPQGLKAADHMAELHPGHRVADGQVQGAPGRAHLLGAERDARQVRGPAQRAVGQPAVPICRQAAGAFRAFWSGNGAEQAERPVRERRPRAPRLGAGKPPAPTGLPVPLHAHALGTDRGQVATRLGFGPGLCPHFVRGGHPGQDAVALVRGAVREQRRGEQRQPVLPHPGRRAGGVVLLLEDQPLGQRRVPAAVGRGPGDDGQPGRGQLAFPRPVPREPLGCVQ